MSTATDQREEPTQILAVVHEELAFAFRIVLCAFYACWWRIKHYLWFDPKLNRGAKKVAAGSGLVLFLDLALFFFHEHMALWLGGVAVVVLLPSALLLTLHRVQEAVRKEKASSFMERVHPILHELWSVAKASPETEQQVLDCFVERLLSHIYEDFKNKNPATVNIMFPDSDDTLRIVYLFPAGTEYDPEIGFERGEGACGFSYGEKKIVYIPAIKYMHGIIVGFPEVGTSGGRRVTYGLKRRLYVEIDKKYEAFASILSLPVTSPLGIHGVLNIDTKMSDAFNSEDIHTLTAYAETIGLGISLCHK